MASIACFDLDGTITRQELLPLIAQEVSLSDEIKLLTDATMSGVLTFDKSLRLRCRLLSDIAISRVQEIVSSALLDPDIESYILSHREHCCIATGNLDVWIKPLTDRLGCRVFSSVAAFDGDRLLGIRTILNKADVISAVRPAFERVIAIGDGMNDAGMFEAADLAVAYCGVHDAVPALIDLSDFVVTDGRALCRLIATL